MKTSHERTGSPRCQAVLAGLLVLFMTVVMGNAIQAQPQPGRPGTKVVEPARYFHEIRLTAPGFDKVLLKNEYTTLDALPESQQIIATFPAATTLSFSISGAHPCGGLEWEKQILVVEKNAIHIDLYTSSFSNHSYPDMIDPFSQNFQTEPLKPGNYDLLLCGKRLGRVVIRN